MSTKIRTLVELIEELNADVASLSGDIDTLRDEIREKIQEMHEVERIANEKLADLAEAIREDIIEEYSEYVDFDEDDVHEEDDEEYIDANKLVEQISEWIAQAED